MDPPCGVDAPAGDGQDLLQVNQLKTMNVAAGHTLTLDGQGDTDTYIVNTLGSLISERNYVINVLDTGAKNDGIDTLTVNGTADPDIFLLRQVSWIGKSSNFSLEYAETPAMVTLLHGTLDDVWHRVRQDVERINYDENINARLTVNGLGGNDFFAVDDNASITTLDGGAGNDTFQIGQAYANPRVAPDTAPEDAFPTVDTHARVAEPRHQLPDDHLRRLRRRRRSSSTATRPRCASKATPATTSSRSASPCCSTRRPVSRWSTPSRRRRRRTTTTMRATTSATSSRATT